MKRLRMSLLLAETKAKRDKTHPSSIAMMHDYGLRHRRACSTGGIENEKEAVQVELKQRRCVSYIGPLVG